MGACSIDLGRGSGPPRCILILRFSGILISLKERRKLRLRSLYAGISLIDGRLLKLFEFERRYESFFVKDFLFIKILLFEWDFRLTDGFLVASKDCYIICSIFTYCCSSYGAKLNCNGEGD